MAKLAVWLPLLVGVVLVCADDPQKAPKAEEKKESKTYESIKIVPDIIKVAPKDLLKVTFANNLEVKEGNELTPTQAKAAPEVTWKGEANAFYTLSMTDPDVPSRADPKFREFQHWLVGNIPGNDISKGEVLSTYIGNGPLEGSGLHRYVFLLYKQPNKINFTEPLLGHSCKNRVKFSIQKFAEKYSLGEPIAGNFYEGQYDSYTPIIRKEIGISITKEGNETKFTCN